MKAYQVALVGMRKSDGSNHWYPFDETRIVVAKDIKAAQGKIQKYMAKNPGLTGIRAIVEIGEAL